MNKLEFEKELKKIFPQINNEIFINFEIYKNFLQSENNKYNLTRLDSNENIYEDYFFESLLPYKDLDFNNKELLDIGSGSGIPGIALKILFPEMILTILESNEKKINFMKNLCNELKIINVNFLLMRAEGITDVLREKFDVVTSRAVAPLNRILEISVPYAKVGGMIIEPKSQNLEDELEKSKKIIEKLNINILEIKQYTFKKIHNVIFFNKSTKTNKNFPRKWQEIIKE